MSISDNQNKQESNGCASKINKANMKNLYYKNNINKISNKLRQTKDSSNKT